MIKILKWMNLLFLLIIVFGVVFSEDIGFIYESSSGSGILSDIQQYTSDGNKGFTLKAENTKDLTTDDVDSFNISVSQIAKNNIRYVYGYLPSFPLAKINEVAASNNLTIIVPQSDSSELCLESVIYGYDRCHSAYSCIIYIYIYI